MRKILFLCLYIIILPAVSSAYTVYGEIYTNDTLIDMPNVTVNIENYTVVTNITGNFIFNNSFSSGNYTVNITNTTQPRYQSMEINITLSSNLYMSIAVPLKPTGTITGCVYMFGGVNPCTYVKSVVVQASASSRIRWFF